MGSESIEGIYTISAWINAELDKSRIVKQRIIGNTAYIAYKDNKTDDIFGVVITFTRRTYHGKTIELIGKIMDENMHPYYYKCPLNVLKALTKTNNASALAWRQQNFINALSKA